MKSIVFICTGNTCRSVMAEYLLRSKINGKDVQISSMGLQGHSQSTSKYAQELCKDIKKHTARPIVYKELKASDVIYVMADRQKNELASMYPDLKSKIFLLHHDGKDIKDPYGGTREDYVHAYTVINEEIDALVKTL